MSEKLKRVSGILLFMGILSMGAIGTAKTGILPEGTFLDYFTPKSVFIRTWKDRLLECHDQTAADKAVRGNKEGGTVVVMKDGSWVALVMEHACCTGAGFNATLYVTSKGEAYLDAESCYCGFSPLTWELEELPVGTTSEFLTALRTNGKKLLPQNSPPHGGEAAGK